MAHWTTLPCFRLHPQAWTTDTKLWENRLGALEGGLQKCGGCFPSLCRRVSTIAVRALLIAERMGSIWIGSDLDTFFVFDCCSTKPIHILTWHPLILAGLMIEHWAE